MSRFWIETYTNYVIVCCGRNFQYWKLLDNELNVIIREQAKKIAQSACRSSYVLPKPHRCIAMYLCTGFSQNTYAEDTSGYIVGTKIISDWVTVKIGLNGLDLDLDRNKHRINLE